MIKTYIKGAATKLSANFTSTEFDCRGNGCCSETKIDEQLINYLQQIRDYFGKPVNVTGPYRCPTHNAETKNASKTSRHMTGQAADISILGVKPAEIAKYAESIGVLGIGLYETDADGYFVHIDTRATKSFWYGHSWESRSTFGGVSSTQPDKAEVNSKMKYNTNNKPLVCMQTQSKCYKNTTEMTPKGVLWHSTAANNPRIKRYVQPSDVKPAEDSYSKEKWLEILGKNTYGNDWNHIDHNAGLNCWIGKLADDTITTVQTMPWNFKPWGCGSGSKGSCNNGWMQFEICEASLEDKDYFEEAYKEACEITAYLCKLYNIDPKGTVDYNGVIVPTILCHADSHKLGLGSNHGDIYHWFKLYNKTMDDVRNDVAKLLGSAIQVKEYELVVDVPTYTNAADAKAKTNAKGTYKKGLYYIFNKYPSGVNGMLNISKDKTGNSAGAWINPAENVLKEEVKEEVQEFYRVRTSWEDAKSQKGAFKSFDSAKSCCQEAGDGYKVFDWNGKEVYVYTAPEAPEQPVEEETKDEAVTTVKAVYDLEYPQKHPIIELESDCAFDEVSCTKAIVAILKNNKDFNIEIAKPFFMLAGAYKIDPMRAISQSILETGWFKFDNSSVKPEQNNYCGLGATGGGVSGAAFDTIEDGVKAQLQHLYAYGCKDALPENETIVDPRFKYVTRGIAPYWEQLAGRWAVPGYTGESAEEALKAGTTYGQKIDSIYERLVATEVTNEDVNRYFEKESQEESVPEVPEDSSVEAESGDHVDVKKVNSVLSLLEKLLKLIIDVFTNKNK